MPRRLLVTALAVCASVASTLLFFQWDAASGPDHGALDQQSPALVTTITLAPERVILFEQLAGRVTAFRRVEIRPQVTGLIRERFVDEGTQVEQGAVFFQIDPAPLEADLDMAKAVLARTIAAEAHARRGLKRADALLERNATSREKYDNARNDLALAQASVAEARAIVERRKLDLDFATIRTPIAGFVGAGIADRGGLASPSSDRALAVVQELDRVYIDLRLPATRLDAIQIASEDGLGPVEILNAAGQPHPQPGRLTSSDVIVDAGTGNISVRVAVENPDMALLPGMYVRARIPRGVLPDARLVPEDAVLRDGAGGAQLMVVANDGRAERRNVMLGDTIDGRVVVTAGVKAGEVVAVRGHDRAQDGAMVQTVSAGPDAAPAPGKS